MTNPDDKLSELFEEYRGALPDPDPSAHFMPKLWQRIDGSRRYHLNFRRLTAVFVSAGIALSLLLASLVVSRQNAVFASVSYAEVLENHHIAVELVSADVENPDLPDSDML
jgi:hypothetical protein